MKRFVQGEDRSQSTLFPESLEDYISEDNPVRASALSNASGAARADLCYLKYIDCCHGILDFRPGSTPRARRNARTAWLTCSGWVL